MKNRKKRYQVVISRLRTGYTMATHGYIINKQNNNKCPVCNVRLTVDHILWDCKETKAERQRANIQNNIWDRSIKINFKTLLRPIFTKICVFWAKHKLFKRFSPENNFFVVFKNHRRDKLSFFKPP
jgi:hypothetical protein